MSHLLGIRHTDWYCHALPGPIYWESDTLTDIAIPSQVPSTGTHWHVKAFVNTFFSEGKFSFKTGKCFNPYIQSNKVIKVDQIKKFTQLNLIVYNIIGISLNNFTFILKIISIHLYSLEQNQGQILQQQMNQVSKNLPPWWRYVCELDQFASFSSGEVLELLPTNRNPT